MWTLGAEDADCSLKGWQVVLIVPQMFSRQTALLSLCSWSHFQKMCDWNNICNRMPFVARCSVMIRQVQCDGAV